MPRLDRFFAELQRRRVLRVALAYGAGAFAIVQAADIYFPVMGVAPWAFRLLAVGTLLGFPVALLLAWIFEFSSAGIRRTQALPAAAGEEGGSGSAGGAPGSRTHRTVAALTATLALFAAVAVVAFRSGRRMGTEEERELTGDAPAGRYTVEQLTAEPGVEWFPGLSPDGEWLVYSGEATGGGRDIFLRSVGGQRAIDLTPDSPADDDQPAFSPDGERIAFRSERDGGGIFVMSRTGEGLRRVTRTGYRPTWSPDGRRLAFATENVELHPQNMDDRSDVWIVALAGGEPRRLESDGDAVLPSWSPHGRRIAFARRIDETRTGGIWTIDTAGGAPVRLTSGADRDWSPAWSPDGRYLYFASDHGGSMNLWRVPVDEETGRTRGQPEPIVTPATSLAHIAVSRDGRRILYSSVLRTINVQRLPIDPASARPAGEPNWVTSGTRRWSSPDPSPDGRRLAMYSLTQPEGQIYVINVDGTGLRQLTDGPAIDRVPRWSPDGEWIAFFSTRAGEFTPWMIREDGSDLRQIAAEGGVPVWAPGGRRLATAGIGTSVIVDPARSPERQTPDTLRLTGVQGARFSANDWSADGVRLAGGDGFGDSGIITCEVASKRCERLTDFGQWPVWLPDGRTLLFVAGGNAFYTVDRLTRRVRPVFTVARDVIGPPRLAPDARSIYYTRRVTEADIWMARFAEGPGG